MLVRYSCATRDAVSLLGSSLRFLPLVLPLALVLVAPPGVEAMADLDLGLALNLDLDLDLDVLARTNVPRGLVWFGLERTGGLGAVPRAAAVSNMSSF